MKHITLLVFALFCLSMTLQANLNDTSSNQWQVYHEDEKVRIEYQKMVCDLPAFGNVNVYKYLRFINLSTETIEVSYDKTVWYNGRCYTCDNSPENRYTVTLSPNEQKTGECEENPDNALQIFHSMTKPKNPSVLSRFELRNISVDSTR